MCADAQDGKCIFRDVVLVEMSPMMAWNIKLEMTISALHNIGVFIVNNLVSWRSLPSYEELGEKLRRVIYLVLADTVKLLYLSQYQYCDNSVKS